MSRKVMIIGILALILVIASVPIFVGMAIEPKIRLEIYGNFPSNLVERRAYVFENSEPWEQSKGMKYFGFKVPTDNQLNELKKSTDLSRRYPETIKAVFTPGPVPNTVELLYFNDELANIGVNTYWVIGEYRINDNTASQFMPGFEQSGMPSVLSQEDAKKMLKWRILLAKKAGFATILIPDYPSAFNIGKQNYDITKIKPEIERVALELAEIAEEYQTEYFSPVNEYERMLMSNGYTLDETVKLEKEFYDEITPKIRQVYRGKIIYKTGNVGEWSNFPKLSMKGADLFGVGNAYTGGAEMTTKNMIEKAKAADLVSERDGVPWLESEFLVYRPIDQQNWMGRIESTYPMEKTYHEGTSAFEQTEQRAVGFTFMSWTGVGRIRGTAAGDVIKDFYGRWKPTEKIVSIDLSGNSITEPSSSFSIKKIPSYYSMFFKLLSSKPQEEVPYYEGPGSCKGKEECEAFCAKPENRDSCIRFVGGNFEQQGRQEQQGGFGGGPGGCKSPSECETYCSKPEHQEECMKFISQES